MIDFQEEWEEMLRGSDLGMDEFYEVEEEDESEQLDEPLQRPLTGKESREELTERVKDRDEKNELSRERRLAHAQRVIQVQYEKHGLNAEFLDDWLWRYIIFLYVRKISRSSPVSIMTSPGYVRAQSFDNQEHMTSIWIEIRQSILRFVIRMDDDGKVIPIHNWINHVFKVQVKKEWKEKRKHNYLHSQIENDLRKRQGGQVSIDFAIQNAHPDFEVGEYERERRKNRPNWLRLVAYNFIGQWPFRDTANQKGNREVDDTEIIVTRTIIQLNTLNAATLTRHLQVGTHQLAPLPDTNVRTIQRIVRVLKNELTQAFRVRGAHVPKPNPRGFELKPPRSDEQEMSINRSFYKSSTAMEPNHWIEIISSRTPRPSASMTKEAA